MERGSIIDAQITLKEQSIRRIGRMVFGCEMERDNFFEIWRDSNTYGIITSSPRSHTKFIPAWDQNPDFDKFGAFKPRP